MSLVRLTLRFLLVVCKGHKGVPVDAFEPLLTNITRVFETRGLVGGIAYVKAVRGNVLCFLSGSRERFPGVALRKSGIPYCLGALGKDLQQRVVPVLGLRLLLTVLFFSRALTLPVVADIGPIVDPSTRGYSTFGAGVWATRF